MKLTSTGKHLDAPKASALKKKKKCWCVTMEEDNLFPQDQLCISCTFLLSRTVSVHHGTLISSLSLYDLRPVLIFMPLLKSCHNSQPKYGPPFKPQQAAVRPNTVSARHTL